MATITTPMMVTSFQARTRFQEETATTTIITTDQATATIGREVTTTGQVATTAITGLAATTIDLVAITTMATETTIRYASIYDQM